MWRIKGLVPAVLCSSIVVTTLARAPVHRGTNDNGLQLHLPIQRTRRELRKRNGEITGTGLGDVLDTYVPGSLLVFDLHNITICQHVHRSREDWGDFVTAHPWYVLSSAASGDM